jgi:hypothetical protein
LANQHYTNLVYGSEASFSTSSSDGGGGGGGVVEKLTISSTSPSSGATGVSVTTAVSATFSMYVNGSTVTTETFKLGDENGDVSGSVVTNGKTITFTPSLSLSYDTKYTGTVTTKVQAANFAGTTMESNYSWDFTTESLTAVTPTPAASPSPTPVVTATPAATPKITATPTPAPSPSPTATAIPTPGPSPAVTPSPLPSPVIEEVVYGYVYDTEGNQMEGVTVIITHPLFSTSTETDSEGYYEFRHHDTGECTLTYKMDGYKTRILTVILGGAPSLKVADIIMETTKKGSISGYVLNAKGNALESASIQIKGTKTTSATTSDGEGYFEFADLDADTYIVTVKMKGYKKARQTVSLADGEDKEIEVTMKKAGKKKTMANNL